MGRQQAAITNSNPSYSIDTPVNHSQWGQAMAGRISMMIANNQQTAQINISPPELGPIQVRISVINDQANVSFIAHQGDVRDAIEEAFPRLKEMLGQSGLSLGESNVSQHSFNRGDGQSENINQDDPAYVENGEIDELDASQNTSSVVTLGFVDQYV